MANEDYNRRESQMRTSKNADQVELTAIRLGHAHAASGLQDEVISDEIDNEPVLPSDILNGPRMERQIRLENESSEIIAELQQRFEVLGNLYPFELNSDSIHYRKSNTLLYEFFLCVSLTSNLTAGKHRLLPRIFERVATELAANFLGPNTKFKHVGAPQKKKSLKRVAHQILQDSELHWSPKSRFTPRGPRAGDAGVDYILWKNFRCGRQIGEPYFFGQCTCGDDWEKKLDSGHDKFFQWFEELLVPPAKIFSLPFVLPNGKLLEASNTGSNIVMDRIRLMCAFDGKKYKPNCGYYYNPNKWKKCLGWAVELILGD